VGDRRIEGQQTGEIDTEISIEERPPAVKVLECLLDLAALCAQLTKTQMKRCVKMGVTQRDNE